MLRCAGTRRKRWPASRSGHAASGSLGAQTSATRMSAHSGSSAATSVSSPRGRSPSSISDAAATPTIALVIEHTRKMVSAAYAPAACTKRSPSRCTATTKPGRRPEETKASAQRAATSNRLRSSPEGAASGGPVHCCAALRCGKARQARSRTMSERERERVFVCQCRRERFLAISNNSLTLTRHLGPGALFTRARDVQTGLPGESEWRGSRLAQQRERCALHGGWDIKESEYLGE